MPELDSLDADREGDVESTRAEQSPATMGALARHIAVVGVSGLITGLLVGGFGSRIFMRIAGATGRASAQGATTEAGFTVGEVTLAGTIELIVFVGIFVGILGAVLYAIFRPWLAWAGRLRGVVFGALLFATGSATSDVMNPDNFDFIILGRPLLDVLLIVGLFVTFGVVMEEVHRILDRRIAEAGDGVRPGHAIIAGWGVLLGIPLAITIMFGRDSCDCAPPLLVAWFTVLAGIGTVMWWTRRVELRLPAKLAGYSGVLGAAVFGLTRALSDAADIIR